jgi:hypothetical protein
VLVVRVYGAAYLIGIHEFVEDIFNLCIIPYTEAKISLIAIVFFYSVLFYI